MASLNKVQLIGNLGKDPEMRFTNNGQAVANFSMATSRSFKKDEEWQEETEWHALVIWGDKAERFCEQARKGSRVYVEGSLKTRNWDDKKFPDVKHYKTEIVVDRFINLTGKEEQAAYGEFSGSSTGAPSGTPSGRSYDKDALDELPF